MTCREDRGESRAPSTSTTTPARAPRERRKLAGGGATHGPGHRRRGAVPSRKDAYGGSGILLLTSANTYLKEKKKTATGLQSVREPVP